MPFFIEFTITISRAKYQKWRFWQKSKQLMCTFFSLMWKFWWSFWVPWELFTLIALLLTLYGDLTSILNMFWSVKLIFRLFAEVAWIQVCFSIMIKIIYIFFLLIFLKCECTPFASLKIPLVIFNAKSIFKKNLNKRWEEIIVTGTNFTEQKKNEIGTT